MEKIIIAPDSFKGTISAAEAAEILGSAAKKRFPSAEIILLPIADGGEGSLDCFRYLKGGIVMETPVHDPFMRPIAAKFLLLPDGVAVIESAEAVGLPLVGNKGDPLKTTTYGVGELIRAALDAGARELILTLGGTSTNDGGAGMASALGCTFLDAAGKAFVPAGGTLSEIAAIDTGRLDARIKNVLFTAMCDVEALPYGPSGATYVFAPQKGAAQKDLPVLEEGMVYFTGMLNRISGKRFDLLPGGGAAGGLGMGAAFFLDARLEKGIEVVLRLAGFDALLQNASLVVPGEGKLDRQSFMGKAVGGIAGRAKAAGVPTAVLAGSTELSKSELHALGIPYIAETNPFRLPFEQIQKTAVPDMETAAEKLFSSF